MTLSNEIQKIRASLGSGGGSLVPSTSVKDVTAKRLVTVASSSALSNASSGRVITSTSYGLTVNHGGGQFSSTLRYYNNAVGQAQVFCQPFTVNQTTGAITLGSGSTLYSAGGSIDTGMFAWAGNYVVTSFQGSQQNGGGQALGVVSNNNVTAYYTNSNSGTNQAVHNAGMSYYRSGNNFYWYPSVYNTSGVAIRSAWFFNGSSFSNVTNSSFSSDTSTNYTWPVVPQFGNNSPVSGYAGIRTTKTSSTFNMEILDSTGGTSNVVNMNNSYSFLTIQNESPRTGWGLELSNGQQLFYSNNAVYRSSGNSLTFLSGADVAPKGFNQSSINDIWPTGVNTWVSLVGVNGGGSFPAELVQFSVNPSTYDVTIVKSVPITTFIPHFTASMQFNTHISLTGSNNQFVVVSVPVSGFQQLVTVFPSPF